MRYVHTFTDRHGIVRHYFRRGAVRIPLPAPNTAGFKHAYDTALTTDRRAKKRVEKETQPATAGVYLLVLNNEVTYIGSSLNMRQRVSDHSANGRPFDKAFFIVTEPEEREGLEQILIRSLNPSGNKQRTIRTLKVAHTRI